MWQKLVLIGLAGAAGTLARYGAATAVQRLTGGAFPWGTMAVNVAGCFLAGLMFTALERRVHLDPGLQLVVLIGFMGAFTTFSTFIMETGHLVRQDAWMWAAANIMLQNVIGIGSLAAGMGLGRVV